MGNRLATQEPPPAAARPALFVVATTGNGTRDALLTATRLAHEQNPRIVLIVPQLTSFADVAPAADDLRLGAAAYRHLATALGLSPRIVCCVCRRYDDVRPLLDPASPVIVGGRRRAVWPTREQRFANRLAGDGYRVVFARPAAPLPHAANADGRQARNGALVNTLSALLTAGLLLTPAWAAAQTEEPDQAPPASTDVQPAGADDPLKNVSLGVTFEGFYQYNWNRPYDRVNLLRAYDTRANVFGIQQTAIVVESAPKLDEGRRFGARVDLQFGQATDTVQGGAANEPRPDVYRHVWQAYGTYVFPVGRGLQTDFGKFASMLGYETNYAKDNNQFSRAYLFNFLPFYHSGLRASLPVGDKVTLMYMLTNGIQQTEDFNNFKSNHVAAIVKPTGAVTWTVNYYFGQEQPDGSLPDGPDGFFRVFDAYVAWTATPALSFGLDANYVTNEVNGSDPETSLQGVGAYARYQASEPAALSVRYERLDDEGLFGGIDQVLQEVTLTAEYKFADGFLLRGEFRRDWSNEAFFTTAQPDERRDHQNTFLVGLVWWFGNKAGAW